MFFPDLEALKRWDPPDLWVQTPRFSICRCFSLHKIQPKKGCQVIQVLIFSSPTLWEVTMKTRLSFEFGSRFHSPSPKRAQTRRIARYPFFVGEWEIRSSFWRDACFYVLMFWFKNQPKCVWKNIYQSKTWWDLFFETKHWALQCLNWRIVYCTVYRGRFLRICFRINRGTISWKWWMFRVVNVVSIGSKLWI